MVWRCGGWFSSRWRSLKGKLILFSSETGIWKLAPRFSLPVIVIPTTIGGLRLYPGKVTYRQGDYLSKMINRCHMHGNFHNLVLILMKAETLDLLNIVVTDHDHRWHKGLQSGFSLLPQETTDCQVDICTLNDYWKVPLESIFVREWGKLVRWKEEFNTVATARMVLSLDDLWDSDGSFELSRIETKGLYLCTPYQTAVRCWLPL